MENSSLVKEEPEPPHIKEEQEELLLRPEERLTSLAVKSEDDGEEPVARTLTDHMKTQAEDCGTSQPASNDVLLSSHCSESDTEDSDEWEEKREDLNFKPEKQMHPTNSHTRKKSFTCTECGKHFNREWCLKRHTLIHAGEKPFTCNVCGNSFVRSDNLKQHMRSHAGEKPFACTVCGKCYIQIGGLKRHTMSHTGEMRFTCTVCGKGFTNLKQHMMVHTGEKPFACAVCGKFFFLKNRI